MLTFYLKKINKPFPYNFMKLNFGNQLYYNIKYKKIYYFISFNELTFNSAALCY